MFFIPTDVQFLHSTPSIAGLWGSLPRHLHKPRDDVAGRGEKWGKIYRKCGEIFYSMVNPPACRRVLWILFVRGCTLCLVFCLCLGFPLAADLLLRLFLISNTSILDIGGLSIHWLLCGTPFTRATFLYMAFSKTLVYTVMLWFKLKPSFTQNPCFAWKPR